MKLRMRGLLLQCVLVTLASIGCVQNVFAQEKTQSSGDKQAVASDHVASARKSGGDGADFLGSEEFGKLPTYIKSNSLSLKQKERVFVYSGSVEVRQGDMILTADTLEGRYNERNEVQELVASSNVVILKGENIRANGNRAVYKQATETVTLTENPELQQEGSVLTADSITIFLQENRSSAEGNVRVKLVKKDAEEKGLLDSIS